MASRIHAVDQVAHRAARQLAGTHSTHASGGVRRIVVAVNERTDLSLEPFPLARR